MSIDYLADLADMGKKIRAIRKSYRETQVALAERAGIRRQTLSDLENGKNASLQTLLAVLTALKRRLAIVDERPNLDNLAEIFSDDE